MNPGLLVVAGLGGYIVYDKILSPHAANAASQPAQGAKQPFWTDWLNVGSQPQTGNGPPKTDVSAVSNAISDIAKFGTSLASFWGSASSSGSSANGDGGVGANTTQVASYNSGAPYQGPGSSGGWGV